MAFWSFGVSVILKVLIFCTNGRTLLHSVIVADCASLPPSNKSPESKRIIWCVQALIVGAVAPQIKGKWKKTKYGEKVCLIKKLVLFLHLEQRNNRVSQVGNMSLLWLSCYILWPTEWGIRCRENSTHSPFTWIVEMDAYTVINTMSGLQSPWKNARLWIFDGFCLLGLESNNQFTLSDISHMLKMCRF